MSDVTLRSRFRLGSTRARHLVLAIRVIAGGAIALFALSTPGFTSPLAINSLLNAISFIGCVAVGMTFITITGNIMSLALGATVSASALVFLACLSLGVFPAFLVANVFGVVITAVPGAGAAQTKPGAERDVAHAAAAGWVMSARTRSISASPRR